MQTFYGHESFVYDLALIANDKFVSTGEDRTVRIWDLATGNVLQVITLPCISVWCVTALPNGDFAVGGSDNLVRVFTAHPEKVAPEEELLKFKEAVQSSSIAEQSLDDLKKLTFLGMRHYHSLVNRKGPPLWLRILTMEQLKHTNGLVENGTKLVTLLDLEQRQKQTYQGKNMTLF